MYRVHGVLAIVAWTNDADTDSAPKITAGAIVSTREYGGARIVEGCFVNHGCRWVVERRAGRYHYLP
jgi:hypothetical protein